MPLNKTANPYQQTLGKVFEKAPKAVIAAVAVSSLTVGGDWLEVNMKAKHQKAPS